MAHDYRLVRDGPRSGAEISHRLCELLRERDDNVDVWYMLAYAHHGALEFDTALEHLEHGEELVRQRGGDESVLENFEELRAAIVESKATVESGKGAADMDAD